MQIIICDPFRMMRTEKRRTIKYRIISNTVVERDAKAKTYIDKTNSLIASHAARLCGCNAVYTVIYVET